MAKEGYNGGQIAEALGIDYGTVWKYVPTTWQRSKHTLSVRLNKLVGEADPAIRARLVSDAKEEAEFLYSAGKALGRRVDRVRRALGD